MLRIGCGILLAGFLAGSASAQSPGATRPGEDCHTTLFGGTSCAQTRAAAKPKPKPAVGACRFGSDAFSRLACVDAKLAALRTNLEQAYQAAKQAAGPNGAPTLGKQQLGWIRERNQKCGIEGKDRVPLQQLRPATKCLEDEINARITALAAGARTQGAARPKQASDLSSSCPSDASPYDRLICSNADLAELDLALRKALQGPKGAATPADERLTADQSHWVRARDEKCGLTDKNSVAANELQNSKPCLERELKDRLAVLAGEFNSTASVGQRAPARVAEAIPEAKPDANTSGQANLSKEMDKIKTALGVTEWVGVGRLARNPYYYKDVVVAVVAKFEQKLSETEAIFTYGGSEIVISGSPAELSNGEPLVVAARVSWNKGVIKPSGDEVLLPAAVYVGSRNCATSCEAIDQLASQRDAPVLPVEVSR